MTAVPGRPPLPPLPPKWTGKYRKRPVVVEAVQLIDDLRNHTEVAAWIEGNGGHAEIPFAEPCLFIETMEGRMRADIGWWVVRGVAGEFYAVRPDIFEETYEPAVGHVRIETGQAAYETWRAAVPDVVCNVPGGAWEDLPATVRAGFAAIAARQPQPAPGGSRERDLPQSAYPCHCKFGGLGGDEYGLFWRKEDADAAAANRAGEGYTEVLGIAILGDQPEQPAPGPAGCACGHAQTGHAFSDVCAVPECPCSGYRHTRQPAPELAELRNWIDDFTSAVINVSNRPVLTALARDLRKRAGLPS